MSLDDAPAGLEVCSGCGIELPAVIAKPHPYMTASAACWQGFGELLGAQYTDPGRMRFHQVVVDAYAAQHPGGDDPRAVRSVGIHLMTLALFLEHAVDPALGTQLHRHMVERPVFNRLEREPSNRPGLTFRHVPLTGPVEAARTRAYEWASAVWASWAPQHDVVRAWLQTSGLTPPPPPSRRPPPSPGPSPPASPRG
jgi:hypothetical protein